LEYYKKILGYVKGTSDAVLYFGGSEFIIKGYVNSDIAGDLNKRRSSAGYVFTFAGVVVSWVSKLQTIVVVSNIEAEYMAAIRACKKAIWIRRLIEELGQK